jgi:hypothetical protein
MESLGGVTSVNEYRITKYNPAYRDQTGAYLREDWISISGIGKSFNGEVLTRDEYERVENAYITAALAFLHEAHLSSLRVAGLENPRGLPLAISEGRILSLEQVGDVIRRNLREEFWCRLEGTNGFVHIGWDYYMYVGVAHPCPTARARAAELGLFVEELPSPYSEPR